MKIIDLSGQYTADLNGKIYHVTLPGTLDENCVGEREIVAEKWHPDTVLNQNEGVITTRFTRKHAWEGTARFTKKLAYDKKERKRIFIEVERARKLSLTVNGVDIPEYEAGTLSTPYVFEVTDYMEKENTIVFTSSNLYEGWPDKAIRYSSAATNETQTNWNGLLGRIELREENGTFIKSVRVLPKENEIQAIVEIDSLEEKDVTVKLESDATIGSYQKNCILKKGVNTVLFSGIKVKAEAEKWDEYEGNLYELTVLCDECDEKTVSFGLRVFGDDKKGHLALNGHRIFIRSEANCCVFAHTGHMPMSVKEWTRCLALYKDYGINCVRFHSHCPPDAAFAAADRMGMLIQPELSNWDPNTSFESLESFEYYKKELMAIIKTYANHPSFCMLTLGNELQCNNVGIERMHTLVDKARELDFTRLYAVGSNEFYGGRGPDEKSDFYTSSNFGEDMIRGTNAGMHGHINNSYPNTKKDYTAPMAKLREKFKKPVFSFEVGQYEILPDFKEIDSFDGVLSPDNFVYIKEQVEKRGFWDKWEEWVEASGELSRIAYREEIEAVLRTEDMSGISLLGLQDFPGQGTALVGMINSHFETKPYEFAKSETFRGFFASRVPLVKMDKYTYTTDEVLKVELFFANYGKEDITAKYYCELEGVSVYDGEIKTFPHSGLTKIGSCSFSLKGIEKSQKCTLRVSVGEFENNYSVWVYRDEKYDSSAVTVQTLEEALPYLEKGEKVFLSPRAEKENFAESIGTHFTTDFWSVGSFPFQEGYMGCVPKPNHPLFNKFPTDNHPDWQWWSLTNSRAMIIPDNVEPVFDVCDSYARLRRLAFMVEAYVGNGRLIISSMGLLEKKEYPEIRAMLNSIYSYMESENFNPVQKLSIDDLKKILAK